MNKLLTKKEVVKLAGISASTIWRLLKTGDFPVPLQLSPRRIMWREADVIAWLDSLEEVKTYFR